MNLLYLECKMGAAGDMLMGALFELLTEKEQNYFLQTMNALGLPEITLSASRQQKCGIYGTHMQISIHGTEEHEDMHEHTHTHEHGHEHEHAHTHEHEHAHTHEHGHTHHHTSYTDMQNLILSLPLSEPVKNNAIAVYRLIGEAEAKAHASTLEQIHFHEVGTLDALMDVVGCCLLIELLHPDKIMASPVHVGSGTVRCAHGILPVPAPATAEILKGVPIYSKDVPGELCTPTGAALLTHFASGFGEMPLMAVSGTGYGMGTKDFSQANCVRAFLGHMESPSGADTQTAAASLALADDCILSLSCNLDDMTGEALGFAMEELMRQGARDVFLTPILMKKGRPGQLLTCLCTPAQEQRMTELIFRHTTTRGVRVSEHRRHVLSSEFFTKETSYGEITIKESSGYHVRRQKPEYEDLARIAREQNLSLADLLQQIDNEAK